MGSVIQLGAFRLDAVFASGGMAEVWRGQHVSTGQAVAIKLMRMDASAGTLWHSAFRAEVRAMARLNHPGVVRVHDYGTVEDGGMVLVPGTPWLAMELVEGGTLLDRAPRDWIGVQRVLAELLDALAEAHAHDVVHRDLKPANVLVAEDGTVKLTDFGIAHALDRLGPQQTTLDGGTPPFMAPEQFEGRFRDTGPWTDLYALGCLAWSLVTGEPPYGHERHWMRAALAHVEKPIPPLRARFSVPGGLEGWLHRLLQKAPVDRFQAAADAAWALALLGDAPASDIGDTVIPEDAPTVLHGSSRDRSPTTTDLPTQVGRAVDGRVPKGSGRPMPVVRPPVPQDWGEEPIGVGPLAGAGLGLFGLRELPLVGRHAERQALWHALTGAVDEDAPRMVVLSGAAGSGKSRLAEWFVQRTRAVGAAQWSVAVHAEPTGPGDGVGAMVARDLRLQGLPREAAVERIRSILLERGVFNSGELGSLAALTLPSDDEEGIEGARRVRFTAQVERFALVLRHLERQAAGRVAAIWVDDVQWGLDALQLCAWLLQRVRFPLVIVATVRDEALVERRSEAEALERLRGEVEVSHLSVGPLVDADQTRLLERWLGLGPQLAQEVRVRTGGNPLFAVQLVGDWVERELLEPSEGLGFELRRGALAEIPDGLHDMWLSRVDRVVRDGPGWRASLQLAAALGMEVELWDWRAVGEKLGLPDPEALIDALVRAKLVRSLGPERVRFEHALLRESVERDARERGVWEAHNLACAAWFEGRSMPGRVGRHLFAANQWDRSVDLLLVEANTRVFHTQLRQAEVSVSMAERALELMGAPEGDPRRGLLNLRRTRILDDRGESEVAFGLSERNLALSREHGWAEHEAESLMRMGAIYRDRPDVPRARASVTEALELWRALGHREGEGNALHELGRLAMFTGDYDDSQALQEQAMAIFEGLDTGDRLHTGTANCHRALGELGAWRRTGLEDAARHLRIAAEEYRRLGMRFGEASCLNAQAEIARRQGDLEAAEAGYRAAIRLTEAMGHEGGDVMRINLGICHLERGEAAGARDVLNGVSRRLAAHERWGLVGYIDVLLMAALAELGDWASWAVHAERAEPSLRKASLVDHDLARFAQAAMEAATRAGRPTEAAQARGLAAWQWRALGDAERADAIEAGA